MEELELDDILDATIALETSTIVGLGGGAAVAAVRSGKWGAGDAPTLATVAVVGNISADMVANIVWPFG